MKVLPKNSLKRFANLRENRLAAAACVRGQNQAGRVPCFLGAQHLHLQSVRLLLHIVHFDGPWAHQRRSSIVCVRHFVRVRFLCGRIFSISASSREIAFNGYRFCGDGGGVSAKIGFVQERVCVCVCMDRVANRVQQSQPASHHHHRTHKQAKSNGRVVKPQTHKTHQAPNEIAGCFVLVGGSWVERFLSMCGNYIHTDHMELKE